MEGRIFARSWGLKPRSWWRTLLDDPHASFFVGDLEIPVRTVQTRSERLKDRVSQAYQEKYNTPGSVHYVKDLSGKKSRGTTTEFIPL